MIRYFLNETYQCPIPSNPQSISLNSIDKATWKCACCNDPILISGEDEGRLHHYIRVKFSEINVGDLVYCYDSGFMEVLEIDRSSMAIQGYRKLKELPSDRIFMIKR